MLELGVPFSDPLADGPVIQRASERALARGVTLPRVLQAVRRIRERSEMPLLLFSATTTPSCSTACLASRGRRRTRGWTACS